MAEVGEDPVVAFGGCLAGFVVVGGDDREVGVAAELSVFLGCTRARAAGLWHGWKPFKLDELAAVADALGVPFMSLAAPGVDEVGGSRA